MCKNRQNHREFEPDQGNRQDEGKRKTSQTGKTRTKSKLLVSNQTMNSATSHCAVPRVTIMKSRDRINDTS